MKIWLSLALIVLSVPAIASNKYEKQLSPNDIKMLYIHTDKQETSSVRQVVILQVSTSTTLFPTDGNGVCDGGLWLNAENSSSSYSMLLAAVAAQKSINVYYSEEPTPWGNVQYCALWRVGIK
jgi:hypothetical protein